MGTTTLSELLSTCLLKLGNLAGAMPRRAIDHSSRRRTGTGGKRPLAGAWSCAPFRGDFSMLATPDREFPGIAYADFLQGVRKGERNRLRKNVLALS
jgi:hypothetical protein